MAPTRFMWKSLGLNTLRILLFSRHKSQFRHRPFILPQILSIATNLRPIVRLSYVFGLANLSKDKLLNAPAPEKLTHEYLLTQASNSAAVSSQQLLTLTVAAIVDIAGQYRKCMEQLICVMENTLDMSQSYPQESLWDEVVALRVKVEEMKKRLRDLSSFMEYVDKVAMGSAEVSYFAGADHSSTSICEMLNTAHEKIKDEYEKTTYLEREFLNAQKEFIQRACEVEKQFKQRESVIKQENKAFYEAQLPTEDECRA